MERNGEKRTQPLIRGAPMAERGRVQQAQARCNAASPVPGPDEHASAWEGHCTHPAQRMQAQQQALSGDQASPDRIATRQPYPRDASVPQLVAAQAVATPDAVALVAQSGAARSVLTYRELDTWANQVAHHLRALGVGPDILVGLCLERSTALVVGALGILKAGGAYVPLDPAYPPERLAFMLQDAQTPVLVTQQRLAERLPAGPWQVVTLDADGPFSGDRRQATGDRAATGLSPVTPVHLAYVI